MAIRYINVNDMVKIQLNERGRQTVREKGYTIIEDIFGYSTWQLYELMKIFSEKDFRGGYLPFNGYIQIKI